MTTPATPPELIARIASVALAHYPDGAVCRCGAETADEDTWATHAAEELDADARRWAEERFGPAFFGGSPSPA